MVRVLLRPALLNTCVVRVFLRPALLHTHVVRVLLRPALPPVDLRFRIFHSSPRALNMLSVLLLNSSRQVLCFDKTCWFVCHSCLRYACLNSWEIVLWSGTLLGDTNHSFFPVFFEQCQKFGQYNKEDPASFRLSDSFSLYPQVRAVVLKITIEECIVRTFL